jgi:hypothetical protein
MGLFDRNNHDRDRGGWGGSPEYGGGQNRGGGFMGGVRRGWDRLENGVRDAMDRDDNNRGYDRNFGNRNLGGQGSQGGSYGTGYTAGGSYYDRTGYDRDMGGRGGWNADPNRSAGGGEELNRYGRDLGDQGNWGYRGTEGAWSTMRNHGRYDQDFGAQGAAWGAGYDRDYGARRGTGGMTGGGTNFAGGGMTGGGMTGGMGMNNAGRYDQDHGWNDRNRNEWRSRSQTDAGDPFGDRQNQTPFRVVRGNQGGGGHWGGGDVDRGDRFDRGDMDRTGYRGVGGGSANARGWNQGVGDDPYYNAQDFRGNYDNEYRGRPRDWF